MLCREGTPLQTQDCPDALFLCRENGGHGVVFSKMSSCTINKDFALLVGIRVVTDRTNPGYCV